MSPAQCPLHLLLLDESSADHLVDRRLHECRANRFPLPSTLAEVRDELAVIADVCSKVIEAVDDLLRSARTGLNETQLHEQVAQPLEGFLGVPVPKQMFEALQALGYLSAGLWPFLLQGLCLLLQHHADQRAAAAGENFEGRTAGGTRGGITPAGRNRQHSLPRACR